MARMLSAAYCKARQRKRSTKRWDLAQQLPRQGTLTRVLYDALMASKGHPVETTAIVRNYVTFTGRKGRASAVMEQLRNFYGLDILSVRQPKGEHGTGTQYFALVGEWRGEQYINHLGETPLNALVEALALTLAERQQRRDPGPRPDP